MRILGLWIALGALGLSAPPISVWSGVYSEKQAARGASVYAAACSRCHREDLSGYSGLRGEKFIENWREDSLSSLWLRVSKTMPAGAPGTLTDTEYLDVLAYILSANEVPEGAQELTVQQVPNIRFEAKGGPRQVPDFSLVQTVGCLNRDPEGIWRLKHASDPVRTREPNASSPAELEVAAAQKPGSQTFRILDSSSLKADTQHDHKAKVKGFLIRKPNDDRLNTTSVEMLPGSCR